MESVCLHRLTPPPKDWTFPIPKLKPGQMAMTALAKARTPMALTNMAMIVVVAGVSFSVEDVEMTLQSSLVMEWMENISPPL